jgi:hypothetical protein
MFCQLKLTLFMSLTIYYNHTINHTCNTDTLPIAAAAAATTATTMVASDVATSTQAAAAPPQYITVSHSGESIVMNGDYSTYVHNKIDFPFGYHRATLCPISDGPDEAEVEHSRVNPSLYGLWSVQILSFISNNSKASIIDGLRVEFHTSSWTSASLPHANSSALCDVPVELQKVIAYNVEEPDDPHRTLAYILIVIMGVMVTVLIILAVLYKHRRIQHQKWRRNTDIRDIEMEIKAAETTMYKAAAKKRRKEERRRKSIMEEQDKEQRTSNPFRDFERRPTDLADSKNESKNESTGNQEKAGRTRKKGKEGKKRMSILQRFPYFGTSLAHIIVTALLILTYPAPTSSSSLPFICPSDCAFDGTNTTYAQKEILLSISRRAGQYILQGKQNHAREVYSCSASFIKKCLSHDEETKDMAQMFETAVHNLATLSRSPCDQGDQWSDDSFLPSYLEFDVLEKLVRIRLQSVADLDNELLNLENINIVDDQVLFAEAKRQLSVAESELQRDATKAKEATRTSSLLKEEVKVLVSKYDDYMSRLSSNVISALNTEKEKIQQLEQDVASAAASKRKKTFWSGLIAGLETVGGAVCCAVGLPEVGVGLIISGVDNAVTAAQTALASPPAGVDADKELKQKALDTIKNIQSLSKQAIVVSTLVREIAENKNDAGDVWSQSTLAKQLPSLFLLEVDQTSFSNYMDAFANNLAATAGGMTEAVLQSNVRELSGTVTMLIRTIKAYFPAHLDLQHATLNRQLHASRVGQLHDLLRRNRMGQHARGKIVGILQVRRDMHAVQALRTIALQRRRFINYALDASAIDSMPSVFVTAPSTVTSNADEISPAPLDTRSILAAAVNNYIYVLKAQAATPSMQEPQSCLVSYTVNATSHPSAFNTLLKNGTLSLLFSPLTKSNFGRNAAEDAASVGSKETIPAVIQPGQRFAYDASVTEMHVFVDLVDDTTLNAVKAAKNFSVMRVRIRKSGTDVRLNPYSIPVRYPTEPISFEYAYEKKSECPVSSSQNGLSSDRSTTLSSSGTSPSMMGMWSISPLLSDVTIEKISQIRILMRVEHKIGTGMLSDGTEAKSASDATGSTQMLIGSAAGDDMDGVCGAIPNKCQFAFSSTWGSSADACNAGYTVSTEKTKHVSVNSIWLGVIIGISVALVPTVLLAAWLGWRLILHNREVKEQRRFFVRRESELSSIRGSGLSGKDSLVQK